MRTTASPPRVPPTRRGFGPTGLVLAIAVATVFAHGSGLAARERLRAASEQQAGLDAQRERRSRESEVLDGLACRVAVGALPLAEAADEAAGLLRPRKGFDSYDEFPGQVSTPRQRAARSLIANGTGLLADDPAAQTVLVERLEAEYREMDPGPRS